jgi:NAD(P)-dependent dehydrogenase (short-subunit alcohol dehydrogenase family)
VYGTGRDAAALDETRRLCADGLFRPLPGDVTSEADVEAAVAEPPRLDLCVCNAGIARITPFLDTDPAELEEVLDVNVVGRSASCGRRRGAWSSRKAARS